MPPELSMPDLLRSSRRICVLTPSATVGHALGLPQHPDEHRPKEPILLAVDH
jgi:hypothetical protein